MGLKKCVSYKRSQKHKRSQIWKWWSTSKWIQMCLMIMVLNSAIIALNWEFSFFWMQMKLDEHCGVAVKTSSVWKIGVTQILAILTFYSFPDSFQANSWMVCWKCTAICTCIVHNHAAISLNNQRIYKVFLSEQIKKHFNKRGVLIFQNSVRNLFSTVLLLCTVELG